MKKLILIIISFFIFNTSYEALDIAYSEEITNHLIDVEIEIAGALKVKELIVVSGYTPSFKRNINYKYIDGSWDKKTINFKESPIYNGQSIENLKVSAFEIKGDISFDMVPEKLEYFNLLEPTKRENNTYTEINNDYGKTLNIYYETDSESYAYYIEYIISNVVVIHEDIDEVNFTFKNLDIGAKETLLRVILPYATESEDYNLWLRAPSSTILNELITSKSEKVGFQAAFTNLKTDVNMRMTLPKNQVTVALYLSHTSALALDKIIEVEEANMNPSNNMKYIIIISGFIYAISSLALLKYSNKKIFIIFLIVGIIAISINYLFRYHYLYIYLMILLPIIIKLLNAKIIKK